MIWHHSVFSRCLHRLAEPCIISARYPQSRVQKVKSTRGSHHRFTGAARHSPRNGFNGFLRDLPGDRAFFVTVVLPWPQNLTPASRRQDHTTSPSARHARSSFAPPLVHRIPLRVRDDRDTPLWGTRRLRL